MEKLGTTNAPMESSSALSFEHARPDLSRRLVHVGLAMEHVEDPLLIRLAERSIWTRPTSRVRESSPPPLPVVARSRKPHGLARGLHAQLGADLLNGLHESLLSLSG